MPVPVMRLPSMDLIRSFVAVGRRMSITLAATDLYVTQSAVSRQIHTLEEMLGVKLLVRGHRSIAFTAEGERLFRVADTAVRQLQEVVGSIAVARERRPVTVSAPIGFVGLWLLPRMGRIARGLAARAGRLRAHRRRRPRAPHELREGRLRAAAARASAAGEATAIRALARARGRLAAPRGGADRLIRSSAARPCERAAGRNRGVRTGRGRASSCPGRRRAAHARRS